MFAQNSRAREAGGAIRATRWSWLGAGSAAGRTKLRSTGGADLFLSESGSGRRWRRRWCGRRRRRPLRGRRAQHPDRDRTERAALIVFAQNSRAREAGGAIRATRWSRLGAGSAAGRTKLRSTGGADLFLSESGSGRRWRRRWCGRRRRRPLRGRRAQHPDCDRTERGAGHPIGDRHRHEPIPDGRASHLLVAIASGSSPRAMRRNWRIACAGSRKIPKQLDGCRTHGVSPCPPCSCALRDPQPLAHARAAGDKDRHRSLSCHWN